MKLANILVLREYFIQVFLQDIAFVNFVARTLLHTMEMEDKLRFFLNFIQEHHRQFVVVYSEVFQHFWACVAQCEVLKTCLS